MVLPQLFAMIAAIGGMHLLLRDWLLSMILGASIYLAYSFGSRYILAAAHRAGIRLSRHGRFKEAIACYEQSYDFFSRYHWIDRYRSVVLMTPSAISYREMALINIAFCHGQLGNGDAAKQYYEKALDEFPDSVMARAGLGMVNA